MSKPKRVHTTTAECVVAIAYNPFITYWVHPLGGSAVFLLRTEEEHIAAFGVPMPKHVSESFRPCFVYHTRNDPRKEEYYEEDWYTDLSNAIRRLSSQCPGRIAASYAANVDEWEHICYGDLDYVAVHILRPEEVSCASNLHYDDCKRYRHWRVYRLDDDIKSPTQ